ncbi:MAG TPA: hypothetical protein VHQ65_05760, partial [Thermoanaerobaculia bacterium]|nr:hypothetical protein [Thermoanaerobaculia bacterium]
MMRNPVRPSRPLRPSWRLSAFVLAVAATVALLLVPGRSARGDDRDLLRTTGAVPYVFFILDTSESMNADIFGNPVPLNGDDPGSKIHMAKKQLYNVFADASEFHYGFAHYNQDDTAVLYKHWLFRPATEPAWAAKLDYPRLDDPATPEVDEADRWVFGKKLTAAASIDRVDDCTSGELLDIDDPDQREALNRFVKGGELLAEATTLWFEAGNRVYRMTVGSPAYALDPTAAPTVITSTVTLEEFNNCSDSSPTPLGTTAIKLELIDDFLYMEDTTEGSGAKQSGLDADENLNGYWTWRDVATTQVCTSARRGRGLESNYDSNTYVDAETGNPAAAPADLPFAFEGGSPVDLDIYCRIASDPTKCPGGRRGPNLMVHPTALRDEGRPVDVGDFLPYDWSNRNHTEFLRRLNPNHDSGLPADFGIAGYFRNKRASGDAWLHPISADRVPLVAAGESPLADSINDYRCWLTNKATGQCNSGYFPCGNKNDPNCARWSPVAAREMGNAKGCVQPYLIIVTDAENSCPGPAPASNTAGLNSAEGVKTWVIAMRPDGSAPGQIRAITRNGKGALVYVENEQQLEDALKEIRGKIEQETRAFASAAVPTVQATVAQQIYLSSFTPLENQSVWPGQVHSFLKPLPLVDGKPAVGSERHNWNAGQALLTQNGGIGYSANQRRVYTSRGG